MLDTYPPFGKLRIGALLFSGQPTVFRPFFGNAAVGGQLDQTRIPLVGKRLGRPQERLAAVLEQLKIMPTPLAKRNTKDIPACGIDDKLHLQRMSLFLARIIPALTAVSQNINRLPTK